MFRAQSQVLVQLPCDLVLTTSSCVVVLAQTFHHIVLIKLSVVRFS